VTNVGRVVRIFDNRRIAVNLGEMDGVRIGDQIDIYSPETDVIDPETSDVLGTYRRRKASLIAREVFPKFSVAYPRSRKVAIEPPPSQPVSVYGLLQPTRYRTELGEVPVEQGEVEGVPTGWRVRLGDIAERLPRSDEEAADAEPHAQLEEGLEEGG
jgi:hypothetical protein